MGQGDASQSKNGWGQATEEAPPRKRNVGDGASSIGFFGQQAAPYPAPFTAFNPQNHPPYGLNPPHPHSSSFGSSSYGQSHNQYAKLIAPYRTTKAPYETPAAPYQPPNLGPASYSKPPSPYSFSHQPYKSHFQPTPTPYSTPAVPPPYSRPPYKPKANYRPAPGNSLAPLRIASPDFGSSQFQPQQKEKKAMGQSPKERPTVFERSVQGGRGRGRDRPGRGLAPPGRQEQGQGQGSGRQQRPLRPKFPPGRPRPPPFTNRAVIPFRDLRRDRRPQQQKGKPNPNAIVGDPFAPIDPSFDFKEFEEEADDEVDVKDEFFQDSDDNPFGRPGFPGSHHEPNSRGGSPNKLHGFQEPGFNGQPLKGLEFDGEEFDEHRFEDDKLDSDGFERNLFDERGFEGEWDKEGNKETRENLKMGMRRKRKEESEVEGDEEPLDFRYSTVGLELFKATRGAQQQPRKPTYTEPGYREPNSQPNNLPNSG